MKRFRKQLDVWRHCQKNQFKIQQNSCSKPIFVEKNRKVAFFRNWTFYFDETTDSTKIICWPNGYFSRICQKVKFTFLVKGGSETSLWVVNFKLNFFSLFTYIMRIYIYIYIYISQFTKQGGFCMCLQKKRTFFSKWRISEPGNGFWDL